MKISDLLALRKLPVSEFVFRGEHVKEIIELDESLIHISPGGGGRPMLLHRNHGEIIEVRLVQGDFGFDWHYKYKGTDQ